MNTFEFLHKNFARVLLPNVTNDLVSDCSRAFKKSHELKTGKLGRLSGWAIVKEGTLILQSDLALQSEYLKAGVKLKKYQAWFAEIQNFKPPVCFIRFTQSTINLNNVYLTHDLRVLTICGPSSFERFNYFKEPGENAGEAHRLLHKEKAKHAV